MKAPEAHYRNRLSGLEAQRLQPMMQRLIGFDGLNNGGVSFIETTEVWDHD